MTQPGPAGGVDAVTGAFSYSGAAIARHLQMAGRRVRTLTGHPERAPREASIDVRPLDFAAHATLVESLSGVTTLYNTYWVRFAHGRVDHDVAVSNSRMLFHAARDAGVERIVHVSITNPSLGSPYPYFRGKAQVEACLADIAVSYAVLRPAILFGSDGVLLNNIAFLLRHLPVFAIGGSGAYRIRPIHVDDLARLAVEHGSRRVNEVIDAVGPDRPTFSGLVAHTREAVGSRALVLNVPRRLILPIAGALDLVLRDVLLTRDELSAMADGLADVDGRPTGTIGVLDWITAHADDLGRVYANELDRHFRSERR